MVAPVLGDRIKTAISNAAGTGTLNLNGAESGYRSFASLTSGSQVSYCIEEGTAWEVGVGTYTSGAPSTLTRAATTDTGFASSTGALVSFTAAAKVYLTPLAAFLPRTPNPPRPAANIGLTGSRRRFPCDTISISNGAGAAVVAGTIYAYPFEVEVMTDAIEVAVTAALAGNVNGGIYALDSNGLPGKLIVATSAPVSTGTTGVKSLAFTKFRLSEPCWVCVWYQAAVSVTTGVLGNAPVYQKIFGMTAMNVATVANTSLTRALAYSATMPADQSGSTWTLGTGLHMAALVGWQ